MTPWLTSSVAARGRLLSIIVLVGSLIGIVLGLVLVERTADRYRAVLDVSEATAVVASEAADPISGLAASVDDLTAGVLQGLRDAELLATTAAATASQVGTAAATNLADSLDGIASIAERIASIVDGVEALIPGDVESAAEDLQEVAAGLEPVADQLRIVGDELSSSATELSSAAGTLAELSDQLGAIEDEIAETQESLIRLPEVADELLRQVRADRDRLGVEVWLWRMAVIVVGGVLAASAATAERLLRAAVADSRRTA